MCVWVFFFRLASRGLLIIFRADEGQHETAVAGGNSIPYLKQDGFLLLFFYKKKQMCHAANLNCKQKKTKKHSASKSPTNTFGWLQIGNKRKLFAEQQEIKATAHWIFFFLVFFFFFFNPANVDGDSHGVRKVAAAAAVAAGTGTPKPPAAAELWRDEIGWNLLLG